MALVQSCGSQTPGEGGTNFKSYLEPAFEEYIYWQVIDEYRQSYIPLIVPVTLLNHYVRKYDQTYLKNQNYLHPHPLELKLRNHF